MSSTVVSHMARLESRSTPRGQQRIRQAILSGHPFGSKWRERWHLGGRSGTLRAAVFGLSDGLVSNLALVLGVAGSGVNAEVVVIAGIAGLLAGAFSMAAGEYVSMGVQRDMFEYALRVEALEIELLPEEERRELADIYTRKGVPEATAKVVAATLMDDPNRALDVHAREELGLDPEELGSPLGAAFSSFATFATGALFPLVPYLFFAGSRAFGTALVCGVAALCVVGGFMARMTARPFLAGALRMGGLGALAAGATFIIGRLFGTVTR